MKKFSYFPYLTKLPTGLLSQIFFSDPFRMETVIITIVIVTVIVIEKKRVSGLSTTFNSVNTHYLSLSY